MQTIRLRTLQEERNALLQYVLDIHKGHVTLPGDHLDYDSINVHDLLRSLRAGVLHLSHVLVEWWYTSV